MVYLWLMSSIIEIKLEADRVEFSLSPNGIDSESFLYYHNLSDKLIIHLDKLLKRNKIGVRSIKSYKILGNMGSETTSRKIIEAFIHGLRF